MTAQRTCRLVTLGCKVNQYESQYVKELLEANGYRETAPDEAADLCIVNTCTVTAEGDAKSRQAIRRLAQSRPAAGIVEVDIDEFHLSGSASRIYRESREISHVRVASYCPAERKVGLQAA